MFSGMTKSSNNKKASQYEQVTYNTINEFNQTETDELSQLTKLKDQLNNAKTFEQFDKVVDDIKQKLTHLDIYCNNANDRLNIEKSKMLVNLLSLTHNKHNELLEEQVRKHNLDFSSVLNPSCTKKGGKKGKTQKNVNNKSKKPNQKKKKQTISNHKKIRTNTK